MIDAKINILSTKQSSLEFGQPNILVCVDESTNRRVMEQASKLATKCGFGIILFHVIESEGLTVAQNLKKSLVYDLPISIADAPNNFLPKYDVELINELEVQLDKEARKILKKKFKFIDPNVQCELKYSVGKVVEKILKYSRKQKVEFIIVGKRDVGKIKNFFLGSTSKDLVEHSKIPVLVVN